MKKTITIIGAGPGIGKAIAKKFGSEGFQVALIARSSEKLSPVILELSNIGIIVEAFEADVMDQGSIVNALKKVKDVFGGIDVLEYSPATYDEMLTPRNISVTQLQRQLDFLLLGAVAAVQEVLPDMLNRKSGAILFTTAISALYPVSFTANLGIVMGALLNYSRVLFQDLKQEGIYSGVAMVAGWVVEKGKESEDRSDGISLVYPDDVAEAHWKLYSERSTPEAIVGDPDPIKKIAGVN